MRKQNIETLRYPHHVRVVRVDIIGGRYGEEQTVETVLYEGKGRCYTNGSVDGRPVDITHRYISIPMRFSDWEGPLKPSSGDTITVTMGNVVETMELKDFEPDNNRTVLYCKRNGNLDL